MMSEESEETTSSSETEDEDIPEDILDKDFFKTLSHLKNKDPVIYDESVNFFSEKEAKSEPSTSQKNEHLFLRDYEREVLLGGIGEDGDKANKKEMTYVEEQKQLKNVFKSLLDNDSDDDDDLLQKKEKTEKEKIEEDEEYISWLKGRKEDISDKSEEGVLKPLRDYWNNPDLDEGEGFLKDYILNQKWKEKEDVIQDSDLSEDGELLEAQDNFEREYNFQNEDGTNTELKRFPRNVEGSLRKKDESRKRKRVEISERKKEKKKKKKLEVQKAQKEKLNEIKARLEQLKAMTGNDTLGVDDSDIIGEFDSEKHDKMMEQLYGDEFYSKEDGDLEKPVFDMDDIECDLEEYENVTRSKKKKDRKRKNKKVKVKDITDIIQPEDENFGKIADEFYSLDCEDFIDDIPCRFKYREVVPNDYGLSVEEILAAEDAELNKWVPLSKLYKLRQPHVEKNEIKTYRKKGMDLQLKAKLLPSLFKAEEEKETENEENEEKLDTINEETKPPETKKSSVKAKKKKKSILNSETQKTQLDTDPMETSDTVTNPETDDSPNDQMHSKINNSKTKINKKKKKKKKPATGSNQTCPSHSNVGIEKKGTGSMKRNGKKFWNNKTKKDPVSNISDNRLLAYDIKPKRFRSKLQFST